MLNLFRLPLWGQGRNQDECLPLRNITHDVMRKFLSRHADISEEEGQRVFDLMEEKMESYQEKLKHKPVSEQYDLIHRYLRELDEELKNI